MAPSFDILEGEQTLEGDVICAGIASGARLTVNGSLTVNGNIIGGYNTTIHVIQGSVLVNGNVLGIANIKMTTDKSETPQNITITGTARGTLEVEMAEPADEDNRGMLHVALIRMGNINAPNMNVALDKLQCSTVGKAFMQQHIRGHDISIREIHEVRAQSMGEMGFAYTSTLDIRGHGVSIDRICCETGTKVEQGKSRYLRAQIAARDGGITFGTPESISEPAGSDPNRLKLYSGSLELRSYGPVRICGSLHHTQHGPSWRIAGEDVTITGFADNGKITGRQQVLVGKGAHKVSIESGPKTGKNHSLDLAASDNTGMVMIGGRLSDSSVTATGQVSIGTVNNSDVRTASNIAVGSVSVDSRLSAGCNRTTRDGSFGKWPFSRGGTVTVETVENGAKVSGKFSKLSGLQEQLSADTAIALVAALRTEQPDIFPPPLTGSDFSTAIPREQLGDVIIGLQGLTIEERRDIAEGTDSVLRNLVTPPSSGRGGNGR